jgi:hypothetical protein
MHRRVGRAHLGEHFLSRHAAVHQPDAARLAVLPLDAIEKPPQGRLVRGVAGQHLIGQRQTFGCHHQGNDDLHTIRPVIARVPEAALVAFRKRRIHPEEARRASDDASAGNRSGTRGGTTIPPAGSTRKVTQRARWTGRACCGAAHEEH